MTKHLRRPLASFSFLGMAVAFGCSSDGEPTDPVAESAASLMVAAEDCRDVDSGLVAQFRADLRSQYAAGWCTSSGSNWVAVPGTVDRDGAVGVASEDAAPSANGNSGMGGTASSGSDSWDGEVDSDKSAGPATVTGTNVQVAGVDEADIVKTDGKNLYVLHDNALELVKATTEGALSSITGLMLEGNVREMFVVGTAGDAKRKVVVIADVNGAEVYSEAGQPIPSSTPGYAADGTTSDDSSEQRNPGVAEPDVSVGVGGAVSVDPVESAPAAGSGATEASGGAANSGWIAAPGVVVAKAPTGPAAGVTTVGSYSSVAMTKVTVLEATDSSLDLVSQVYYDGSYQSSRREGTRIHAVLQIPKAWPGLESCPTDADRLKAELVVIDQLSEEGADVAQLSAEYLQERVANELVDEMLQAEPDALLALTYSEFVPRRFVLKGNELVASALECDQMYLPKVGSSLSGITYIAEIDLGAPTEDAGSAAILGQSSILYGNGQSLILATNQCDMDPDAQTFGEVAYVHRFELGEDGVSYRASAEFSGRIKDQFSLDLVGDDLRVVSSEGSWREQQNSLSVWRSAEGSTLLSKVGSVDGIGTGEDVKSVRFLGDTAYVVTYMETDPLFAVDLSDGTNPTVLGSLGEIPGFSTYIHPIDDDHLLTVGYDTDSWTPMIQVFDVTNRTEPVQEWKLDLSPTGSSLAVEQYKAFTYYPEQKLLSIPFSQYSGTPMNSMALFRVELTTGIQLLGYVDGDFILGMPPAAADQYCYNWGDTQSMFARSVFFDDVLFAIAPRGLAAVSASDPTEVYSRLVFSAATEQTSYYCEGVYPGEEGGAAGAVGVDGDWAGGAGGTSGVAIGVAGAAAPELEEAGGSAGDAVEGASGAGAATAVSAGGARGA